MTSFDHEKATPGQKAAPVIAFLTGVCALWFVPWAFALELEGKAVDAAAAGLGGTTIWAAQDHEVLRGEADETGAFTITGLKPLPADVVAWRDGYAVGGAHVAVVGVEALALVLDEADELRIAVKGPAAGPVAGARIKHLVVNDALDLPVEDLARQGFPQARSNEEGRLVVGHLPKGGHVRFVLAHRDYADTAVAYLPVGGKEQTILLSPGVTLRGRVTTPDGRALARARVAAFQAAAGGPSRPTETLADPEGFYHLRVRPGEYFVAARHPDYASPRPQPIPLLTESDANVLDLEMAPPHRIEGVVTLPDGAPCIGAPVSYWIGDALYEEVLTQRDGRFHLLAPGAEGAVHVTPPIGFMTEILGDIAVSGKLEPHLVLDPIRLIPLPAIEGEVVDADGESQPAVLIASLDLGPPVWAITDEQGRFRIQLDQMPPEPKASFRAEHGRRFRRADFEVRFGKLRPVAVQLGPFEPDLASRAVTRGENDLTSMVGDPAPDITCSAWFNSEPLTLPSLRGKVVVLLFWGAFEAYGPIRTAVEELRALHDVLRDVEDVAIVAIHDGVTEAEEAEARVKEYGVEFPVGLDAEPFQTFEAYEIRYIPEVVLIDKAGRLRYFQTEGRLLELIKALRREA